MNSSDIVKYLIETNLFMTLATAAANGKPWSSPVGFVYDDDYNLYWVSNKDALHSQNIATRPEVAISIFGKVPDAGLDGVYIDALAALVEDNAEVQKVIELFATKRPQPDRFAIKSLPDVSGAAVWRVYRATPVEISKRSSTERSGQAVTIRETVTIK